MDSGRTPAQIIGTIGHYRGKFMFVLAPVPRAIVLLGILLLCTLCVSLSL